MASRQAREYWEKRGYRNIPGSDDIPQGRSGEALIRADAINNQLEDTEEQPEIYAPTSSSNPSDPRTSAAHYFRQARVLQIFWGDGGPSYYYADVSPTEWAGFRRRNSPGKWVNEVGNYKDYSLASGFEVPPTRRAAQDEGGE